MHPTARPPGGRYHVLDALRGICALCVCLFHFRAAGPIATLPFVRGSWLFVDFFFVLSGFVIAANYRHRLTEWHALKRFALLRLGRVWPLHLATLAAFVAFEAAGALLASDAVMNRPPFAADRSPFAILTNIFMVQIFGLHTGLTWNYPAWSIAAEFWTYLIFAALAIASGARLERLLLVLVPLCALGLAFATPGAINVTHEWSLLRCFYGFSVGVLVWSVWNTRPASPVSAQPAWRWTMAELAVVALIIVFVSFGWHAPINLAAPFVFGLAILLFAAERGAVSAFLQAAVFRWLGLLSYSIYMVHSLVQSRFEDALRLIGLWTGRPLVSGTPAMAGTTSLEGTVFTMLMLLLVVLAAWIAWRLVEQPMQAWTRRVANRAPAVQPA